MKIFTNIEYGLFISLAVLTALLIYRTVLTYWRKDHVMKNAVLHTVENYESVNGSVNFQFELLASEEVSFSVLSQDESKVDTVIDSRTFLSGSHQVEFDASKLNKGWYWYRLETDGQRITKKFQVV